MIRPYNFDRYRSTLIDKFLLSPTEFDHAQQIWEAKKRAYPEEKKAFLWSFLNHLAKSLDANHPEGERKYTQLQSLHQLMWAFLIVDGKNGTNIQRLANYYALKLVDLAPYKTYVMIISDERCPEGCAVNGVSIPLEDALRNQPIPYEKCSRPQGCICCYGIHGERGEEGRLLFK